jgi:hypothetical protein
MAALAADKTGEAQLVAADRHVGDPTGEMPRCCPLGSVSQFQSSIDRHVT